MPAVFAVFWILVCFATPSFGQSLAAQRMQEFAINNLNFALHHEVGHLLISEFKLPVLGKQEDAADNIATMLLLAKQGNQALIDSANGWRVGVGFFDGLAEKAPDIRIDLPALYDSHSPDFLRAGQIGCLMVGSRREVFANVAVELGLGDNAKDTCAKNLGQMIASWLVVKRAFIQAGMPTHPVNIVYGDANGFETARELLEGAGLMEDLRQQVLNNYALPRPVTLRAASCGTPNAYFDPDKAELLICYELAAFYLAMAKDVAS